MIFLSNHHFRNNEALCAWFIYLIFFLLLFVQFPLRGELPGNVDTVLAISLANILGEKLRLIFSFMPSYTALFPASGPIPYGENCYGHGLIYLLIKLFSSDDIIRYYLYFTLLFSLNAVSFFCLSRLFVVSKAIALASGLFFATSGFVFSNMDDPNVIFLFFPILAFTFLIQGVRNASERYLSIGFLLSATQIWFGAYIFFFQTLALLLFIGLFWKHIRQILSPKSFLKVIALALIITMPLVSLYLYNYFSLEIVSPFGTHEKVFELKSFALHNFWNVLPNNLLYSDAHNIYGEQASFYWTESRKLAFPGIVLTVCSLLGFYAGFSSKQKSRELVFFALVFCVFTTLSFGTNFPLGNYISRIPIISYIRVPSRFYLFSVISEFVFLSLGIQFLLTQKIFSRFRLVIIALVSITALFLLDNVPFPFRGYNYDGLLKPSNSYIRFFENRSSRNIILDLPSRMFFLEGERFDSKASLSFFTRELLYMNWASYHHQIILGGGNGYYPKSRSDIDPAIQSIPDLTSLQQVNRIGVKYIVFHKKLLLNPNDHILPKLLQSPHLLLRQDTDQEAIFEIVL